MLYVKPYFYDDFVCKAGECKDTCCAGWEITVDESALEYYGSSDCPASAEIMQGITVNSDGEAVFRLSEYERCHFLCDDGLCRIYSACGKDALCDICREHPRFYNFYDDCEETGLGLCCEKVCELLFADDTPFRCIEEGSCDDEDYNYVADIRDICFDIIENSLSAADAAHNLLEYAFSMSASDDGSLKLTDNIRMNDIFIAIISLFAETEPINEQWTALICEINKNLDKIINISENTEIYDSVYKKFTAYVIYRHLIDSVYNSDIVNGIAFAVAGLIFLYICSCFTKLTNGKLSRADVIENIRLFSKQIEYSNENMQIIVDGSAAILFDKV